MELFDLIYNMPSGIYLGIGVSILFMCVGAGMAYFGGRDLILPAVGTMALSFLVGGLSLVADGAKYGTDYALEHPSMDITPPVLQELFYTIAGVAIAAALGGVVWQGLRHNWALCALFGILLSAACSMTANSIGLQANADIWQRVSVTFWATAILSLGVMIIALARDNRRAPDPIQDGRIVDSQR